MYMCPQQRSLCPSTPSATRTLPTAAEVGSGGFENDETERALEFLRSGVVAAFARSRLCVQDVASRVALRGVDAQSYLVGSGYGHCSFPQAVF